MTNHDGKMQRLVKVGGGFVPEEYQLELYKGNKIEFKIDQCELGGIHIYIDGDFYDCIETTHHWRRNNDLGYNQPVPNSQQKGMKVKS